MKKYFVIVLLILLMFSASCSSLVYNGESVMTEAQTNTNQTEQNENVELIINEVYRNNRISVFENNLPRYEKDIFKKISVKTNGSDWSVNNINYKSIPVTPDNPNKYAFWKVDLSKLSPLGACDGILLFSAKDQSSDSVIVALYGNNMFFLVCDDILSPAQYTIYDFEVELYNDPSQQKPTEDEIIKLWNEHLAGEHDLSMVIMEDSPSHIRFRLKNHPELIYNFSYILYGTYYCSPLPFKE